MFLASKHIFCVMKWKPESENRELQKFMWSCQNKKKQHKSIPNPWNKTTSNNDFYNLILFNSNRIEVKQKKNKKQKTKTKTKKKWSKKILFVVIDIILTKQEDLVFRIFLFSTIQFFKVYNFLIHLLKLGRNDSARKKQKQNKNKKKNNCQHKKNSELQIKVP